MIWQNPWAWAGLGVSCIAGADSPARPRSSTAPRVPDAALSPAVALVADEAATYSRSACCSPFDCGILASAVIALAQPFLVTSKRRNELSRGIARAIVVDTSESMRQADANGARPIDAARRESERLARDAQTSLVIQSATPRRALAGAADWIARQQRRAELVIVSDFQTGTIDRRDLDAVPRAAGFVSRASRAAGGSSESVAQRATSRPSRA